DAEAGWRRPHVGVKRSVVECDAVSPRSCRKESYAALWIDVDGTDRSNADARPRGRVGLQDVPDGQTRFRCQGSSPDARRACEAADLPRLAGLPGEVTVDDQQAGHAEKERRCSRERETKPRGDPPWWWHALAGPKSVRVACVVEWSRRVAELCQQ